MRQSSSRYADWKAPAEDGQVLIWPDAAGLLHDTRRNHQALSSAQSIRLQQVPLPQVRAVARRWIGHDESARPLIITGHQTELQHPGVWVKNVLIDTAARKLDGEAVHVAVDSDSPKHLQLRWPDDTIPITDDPAVNDAPWTGLLNAPSPAHIHEIRRRLDAAAKTWDFVPTLGPVLTALRKLALESPPLPEALVNAVHELEWDLGLRHQALLASPIWSSEGFLLFAHHLLADAPAFASRYNAALAAYRAEAGVRSSTRPMPDLLLGDDACEVPFWLDDLAGARRVRPSVKRRDGGWMLEAGDDDAFVFDPAVDGWAAAARLKEWLTSHRVRLAPRALTLTMFLRLALADQFVHGIGGGRYDQVTDRIIADYFRIDPPRFAVTTATMFFPQALGQPRVCVPCVVAEGHRLKHSLLGERKMQLVEQISALPRRSPKRSELFAQMHKQLHAEALQSSRVRQWEQRLRETQEREIAEQTLFDRELFFALQPRDRLEAMIAQFHEQIGSA